MVRVRVNMAVVGINVHGVVVVISYIIVFNDIRRWGLGGIENQSRDWAVTKICLERVALFA
jgi:hypothetical protein